MPDHAAADSRPTTRERVEGRVARLLRVIPGAWLRRLSRATPITIDGRTLDPHVQFLLHVRARKGTPGLCEPNPAAGRARYRREIAAMINSPTPVGEIHELTVPGGDGATLHARHYAPVAINDAPRPLLVFFHGGGFVIGDLETHDEPCRLLCLHANTHVLSVAYRLAPEFPFPCAVHDSIASLRWAVQHAASLGADASNVAVGGDSAGANLATVASLALAAEGLPVSAQLLIYPTTDSASRTESRAQFATGFMLQARDMEQFGRHYLRREPGAMRDPRVSPLYATNLQLAPPALIVTAGFDPLTDEGTAYAAALQSHGVIVRVLAEDSLIHGFLHLTAAVPRAMYAVQTIAAEWQALTQPTAHGAKAGTEPSLR